MQSIVLLENNSTNYQSELVSKNFIYIMKRRKEVEILESSHLFDNSQKPRTFNSANESKIKPSKLDLTLLALKPSRRGRCLPDVQIRRQVKCVHITFTGEQEKLCMQKITAISAGHLVALKRSNRF